MTWVAASVATAEAIAVAEALAVAEAAAAAAAAAEAAAVTATAAEAASAGITAAEAATAAETAAAAAETATAAETGAQGIMQAVPEATNVAAEGSNVAAEKMQEEAVKQGLEQATNSAVNPDQAMFEEMQRQMAQESANPTNFGPGTQYASLNGSTPALPNSGATSVDPFGGFPNSGAPPPGTDSAANVINGAMQPPPTPDPSSAADVINGAMQQPTNPFMDAYSKASEFVETYPKTSIVGGYGLLSASGALNQKGDAPPPKRTFNNPYRFSPDFQGTHPNPNDYQYTPKYPSYAMGGIAGMIEQLTGKSQKTSNAARLSPNFKNAQVDPNDYHYTPKYAMGGIANIPPQTNFANPSQSMMGTSQYDMPIDSMSGNIANRMASGGIADVHNYKSGGKMDVYDASLRFADMMDNPNRYSPPDTRFYSVETFRDTNPNTSTKSPDEAAEIRRKAIEQRSYVNTGAKYLPPSRRPGQLDLGPVGGERGKYDNQESVLAAQGGIMGYNLGGYASGGNPRLLRGPGDGMSDNIPATIADRQPARLADGEFVIPADVVSHLGNGSTEAGAKKLHEMMNSVRKARTGNPKQGKKINPSKFMPKK
jgi:hypothetical protein